MLIIKSEMPNFLIENYSKLLDCKWSLSIYLLYLIIVTYLRIYNDIKGIQLTLFDMGGMVVPQNVFDHCAQMLRRRKLKLGDF